MTLPALYTLGSRLLVVLDAGLSYYSSSKRVCIPLRRPAAKSMVFERVHFPPSPLSIPFIQPHKLARYSLYALSKPTPSTLKSQPHKMPSKFGLLLLFQPTASQFMEPVDNLESGLPANRPLLTKEYYISTHPPRMFDESRDLLFIPLSWHEKTPWYTLTLELKVSKPAECRYYLFFAIESSRNPRWHCYITTEKKLSMDDGWPSSIPRSTEIVDRYFQKKFARIWKSGTWFNRYQLSDQLHVAIGKRLDVHPEVDARWCVLSGSRHLSVDLGDDENEGSAEDSDSNSTYAQARRN